MIWGSLLYGMNICVWARLISKSSASKSTYGVYSPQSIRCDFCPLFSKSPRPDLSPFFSIKIVFSSQFTIHQEWVWFIASKINCIWLLSPESFEPARFLTTFFFSREKTWHEVTRRNHRAFSDSMTEDCCSLSATVCTGYMPRSAVLASSYNRFVSILV